MEKIWELVRLCRQYIQENSKVWKDEEEMRRVEKDKEEKRLERLRELARKKRKIREAIVHRKITDTLHSLPKEEREKVEKEEKDGKRKEMR